ncbi:ParB/RepB/Spo0J family partition protein [Ochrobactrum tritici]|uniref:ParB/RepB/Spo0J family partition protein n=1 Tax=Brucella tritici TaxID=94626 RepID=A0A7X6FSZ3_9HYPH|nr:ParB/RepB/Spo0J family partition protein [Brucella tritici]
MKWKRARARTRAKVRCDGSPLQPRLCKRAFTLITRHRRGQAEGFRIRGKQAEGHVISELSHELIDFSFVKDRIDVQQTNIDELAEDISAHGQQSPILVRPHPDMEGRYQIVYGHRRYLATKSSEFQFKR